MKGQLVFELLFVAAALAIVLHFGDRMLADLAADPSAFKMISAILAFAIPVTAGLLVMRHYGPPRSAIANLLHKLIRGRDS